MINSPARATAKTQTRRKHPHSAASLSAHATERNRQLRDILLSRKQALQTDLERRIADGRADRTNDIADELERTDANTSDDVEFALMRMKSETVRRIDDAIGRLDVGQYGRCSECGSDIAESRLRAVPFAVRCKGCESGREQSDARSNQLAAAREPAFSR